MSSWLEVWRYARQDRATMARLWCVIACLAVSAGTLAWAVVTGVTL